MKLENVKEKIDLKIDSMLPTELYNALKECGMPEPLKIGDKFQQISPNCRGLICTILEIKPKENWCKIYVIHPLNHYL